MRVLHTSDWHLGLSTGPVARAEDHRRFLDWLLEQVEAREIDALVVAGDVFDTMQPSADAQRLYYRFLAGLARTGVGSVVIVGGNHDSPSRLDAPRELLDALEIHVVGGLPPEQDLERLVVPVRAHASRRDADHPERPVGVCLAVPYVHEYRLGVRTTDTDTTALAAAFRSRFADLYTRLADLARAQHPHLPLVATGHLTVGAEHRREDYPQEIHQVGSIDALPADVFDPRIQYAALGHIHRCYPVGGDDTRTDAGPRGWYCGTPIPTSLTERHGDRHVLEVDVPLPETPGRVLVRRLTVPRQRALHLVEGELDEVETQLTQLAQDAQNTQVADVDDASVPDASSASSELAPLVFVRVTTREPIPDLRRRLEAALDSHEADDAVGPVRDPEMRPIIVELRELDAAAGTAGAGTDELPALESLTPSQVFRRLCEASHVTAPDALERAFQTLATMPEESFETWVEDTRTRLEVDPSPPTTSPARPETHPETHPDARPDAQVELAVDPPSTRTSPRLPSRRRASARRSPPPRTVDEHPTQQALPLGADATASTSGSEPDDRDPDHDPDHDRPEAPAP